MTELGDKNLLRFGLGDRAHIEKFVGVSRGVAIAPCPGKKDQKKIDRPRQSTLWGSRPQQQQLSPSPQPGSSLPKALSLITPQKYSPQEFHRLKADRYSNAL
ncbi:MULTISPECIES: hypothetical protein [unclassified Microcoleus]|uniref:hypothetical protein n=1 Tax=unclassified Microcoleus TaxID=2642155 RepID=UPI002FD655CA